MTRADGSTATSRMQILDRTTLGGYEVFPTRKMEDGWDTVKLYLGTDRTQGVPIWGVDVTRPQTGTVRFDQALYVPDRMAPGQTHTQEVPATGTGVGASVVKARIALTFEGIESVQVPAGSFNNCVRFQVTQDAFDSSGNRVDFGYGGQRTWWLAADVGLVKAQDSAGNRGELTNAQVGGNTIP